MNQRKAALLRTIVHSGIAILAILLFLATVKPAFAQAAPANFDAVDDYISTRMKELGIPGAALVIVQGDEIVHLKAFGVADAGGRPVTPQTPFITGSTGKSFTALAVMQLVEAGRIKLDAPVQTYLPWFRVADVRASRIITVRQLLNMVSGIPRSIGQEQLANADLSDSAIENNVRALAKIELIAPPGERYEYSNSNYVTLGMIIQAVTGQSYETYIREHIFNPLDMQNSFASKTEAQQNGLAAGYRKWFGVLAASPNLPFARGSLPAGNLAISAEDFGHYLIAQLNNGNYQGTSVLSPAGIAEMHHPGTNTVGSPTSYGMGWEVRHFQDVKVIEHDGASPGYATGMFLVPEKKLALALVTNTYSPMLGLRVARVPANALRILLEQVTIPGNEFLHMQIVYALVMLTPFLHLLAVLATFRRIRLRRARFIALSITWNAALAYILLVLLPAGFGANLGAVLLFQPDVGWVAVISGIFAIVWAVVSTGIVAPRTILKGFLSALRVTRRKELTT